jgi:hypothetical protein
VSRGLIPALVFCLAILCVQALSALPAAGAGERVNAVTALERMASVVIRVRLDMPKAPATPSAAR